MPYPGISWQEMAGRRQSGWREQRGGAFAAPGQFVLPPGAVSVSGTGAQSPGQVPAGRVSLSSCLSLVQGFEPPSLLIIRFPLSHISGPSLELVAGTSPCVAGGARFPAPGSTGGGRKEEGSWGSPLCHISALVALTQECLTSELCP